MTCGEPDACCLACLADPPLLRDLTIPLDREAVFTGSFRFRKEEGPADHVVVVR